MKSTIRKTKNLSLLLISIFISLSTSNNISAQGNNDITGQYHLPNKLDIEIYRHNGVYQGKIIALNNFENGQWLDINNPETKNRKTPLIGLVIINDLKYNPTSNQWINGTMYSPDKGITVDLTVKEYSKEFIIVEGSKFFFSKTIKWYKIN